MLYFLNMLINIIKLLNKAVKIGASPTDSKSLKLKKSSLVVIPIIIGAVSFIWLIIYTILGQHLSAAIPFFYSVISLFNLWYLHKTKNIILLQKTQITLILILPFLLMWSLGGFAYSSFVMLWAFFAPIAALVYEDKKHSLNWFFSFLALLAFSVLIDPILIENKTTPLPSAAIELFFFLNISMALSAVFVLIRYFIRQKDKNADERLKKEHDTLLTRTKELKKANSKLELLAHNDVLTGLNNKALFNDRLSQSIKKAKRYNSELAILFIDLDRFKQINDSFGHSLGDKVLKIIAKRLANIIREEDTLARLGGDEFTILMEDIHKKENAAHLAEKILTTLTEAIHIDIHTFYVTGSIGISLYPQDATQKDTLLMYADTAMYKAKNAGKNNVQFYHTEMTAMAVENVVMQANLHKALNGKEFVVYYQPQLNVKTAKYIGMEALVRWQHPVLGLLLPSKFMPVAKETGFIVSLDQWVMKTAMKQMVQWHKEGLTPGILALNLSIKQLHQKDFISLFKNMLLETGCNAKCLELEVTESEIMDHPEDAILLLNELRNMGIKLTIDDFGTGYSSLSYLKRLPINKVKIDKTFIQGLPHDEEDVGIAQAIIALAKSLKLSIIAEGVESTEQRDFLLANGCDNIQGYISGKPMPADEMEVTLLLK